MENKDINVLEKLDKIYFLLNDAYASAIIEDNERNELQEAICSIQEKYKQDEKMIGEMAKYIENDSRFMLSPVARGVKEDLLKILKGN